MLTLVAGTLTPRPLKGGKRPRRRIQYVPRKSLAMPLLAQEIVADLATESGKRVAVSLIVTVVTAAVTFLLGRYWGRYKANREWRSKEFLDRAIVSLNIFDDGTLKIRTVMEQSLGEMFLNRVAIDKILAAARECTAGVPILPVPVADRWYLLNFALNAVAEQFVAGLLRLDAGLPVTKLRYAVFLTCEVMGPERIRKIRVMMIQERHLREFPYPDTMPNLESPLHDDRVRTLRLAAELFARAPDNFIILEAYTH